MGEFEPVTLGIAILGAVTGITGIGLSIWAMYRELDRDRVKLKVIPNIAIPVGDGYFPHTMTIEVTNLSAFPVSIAQVGVLFRDSEETGFCLETRTVDGGPVHRRMDPRTSMSVMFPAEFIRDRKFGRVRCALVTTACGERVEGTSGALEQMVREARQA